MSWTYKIPLKVGNPTFGFYSESILGKTRRHRDALRDVTADVKKHLKRTALTLNNTQYRPNRLKLTMAYLGVIGQRAPNFCCLNEVSDVPDRYKSGLQSPVIRRQNKLLGMGAVIRRDVL